MWRFVHLTDTHLGSLVDGEWNNRFLCTMMPDVMNCLRRDLAALNPDFILLTGDIASQQTCDAALGARDFVDSLGFPYFPMGGNHDFLIEQSRDWFLQAYQAHLPADDTVYSFTHKGLHFCVLDPWWKWKDGSLCPFAEKCMAGMADVSTQGSHWAVPPNELAWLEGDLEAHRALPTIVAVHEPAVRIPKRMRRPGMKDAGHLDNGPLLIETLQRYPHVKALFSGHMHMHFIERAGGLTHVITGAMPEYPTEYRDVHVYEDRLEIHTCPLSDFSFASRSSSRRL